MVVLCIFLEDCTLVLCVCLLVRAALDSVIWAWDSFAHRFLTLLIVQGVHTERTCWMSGVDELIKAARRGDEKSVRCLVAEGVDVNAGGRFGYTALTEASYSCSLERPRALSVPGRPGRTLSQLDAPKVH